MKKKGFEGSLAWQKAMDLMEAVDVALEGHRNFGFRDQLYRAALSICNNLAEGYEMPTKPHQLRYLWISKGSCNEVRSMLLLARRRNYFNDDLLERMSILQDEVSRLIKTYINRTGGRIAGPPVG
ncbi:MAG: four helix bundle protein [Flavobacteriales bacterium]|nr:four helix bundle protein [Flavobacteriales bacterium]MCB9168613.1 four helix bundle protein [Flavobacteriales bacterium]